MTIRTGSYALCLGLTVLVGEAAAYEYPLQFTPNPGYQNLIVAGYGFQGNNVVGSCSYVATVPILKAYYQTCTWDLHGNLLTMVPGAPAAPSPLYTIGTITVYAKNGAGSFTGVDTRLPEGGFVNSPSSHFRWLTPHGTTITIPPVVYTLTATLESNGDLPLNISSVQVSALLGAATLVFTTCNGEFVPGATCYVTVQYDATRVTTPAYETLRIDVTSDAPAYIAFVQNFTVRSPQVSDGD